MYDKMALGDGERTEQSEKEDILPRSHGEVHQMYQQSDTNHVHMTTFYPNLSVIKRFVPFGKEQGLYCTLQQNNNK